MTRLGAAPPEKSRVCTQHKENSAGLYFPLSKISLAMQSACAEGCSVDLSRQALHGKHACVRCGRSWERTRLFCIVFVKPRPCSSWPARASVVPASRPSSLCRVCLGFGA